MPPADYKLVSEMLTELQWLRATFTSFIPEGTSPYKILKGRTAEVRRLRDLCEEEAMKEQK